MKILVEDKEYELPEETVTLEIPIDTTIVIDNSGFIDVISDDWAKPEFGKVWESDKYNIVLCDYNEAIEYTLDVLFHDEYNFPEETGSYKVTGDIILAFNIDGLYETSEDYREWDSVEREYYWDTETEINTDAAEVSFDEYKSEINNLKVIKVN